MATTSLASLLLFSSLLVASQFYISEAKIETNDLPIVKGLSWTFYDKSCPQLEDIVRKQLKKVFKEDVGQAAGLLRLHFHDCFVQVNHHL